MGVAYLSRFPFLGGAFDNKSRPPQKASNLQHFRAKFKSVPPPLSTPLPSLNPEEVWARISLLQDSSCPTRRSPKRAGGP